jgi:hypothetical protein
LSKSPDPGDGPVEGTAAGTAPPVDVVQPLRAVDADPDVHVMLEEEPAPLIVDQRSIGLERVCQHQFRRLQIVDQAECPAVEIGRQHQRFAGMPDDADAVLRPTRREDL